MTDTDNKYQIDVGVAHEVWDKVCGPASARFALVPGQTIQRYDRFHEQPLERVILEDWTAFEYGHLDWNHRDFARLLALDQIPADVPLILITDEGLRDGKGFQFLRIDFQLFAGWYSDFYNMDFFQSADYLIFDESLRHVRILHHEGALFRAG